MKQRYINYLKNNAVPKKNLDVLYKLLNQQDILLLFPEYFKDDLKKYVAINNYIKKQYRFYECLMPEILAIRDICDFPIAFLKGATLALDLYENPGMRIGTDIDVIVELSNMDKFVEKCNELGYRFRDNKTYKSVMKEFNNCPLNRRLHHIEPLYKGIDFNGQKFELTLEAHVGLTNYWFLIDSDIAHQSLKNREMLMINNEQIPVLQKELVLCHLFYCFSSDYLSHLFNVWQYAAADKQIFVKLKYLFDIILFMKKYEKVLDYTTLQSFAIKFGFAREVAFGILVLKPFFSAVCFDKLFKSIIHSKEFENNYGYNAFLYGYIKNNQRPDFLLSKTSAVYKASMDYLLQKNLKLYCYPKQLKKKDYIYLDMFYKKGRKQSGFWCGGDMPFSSTDCSVRISSLYDSKYLYFNFEVYDNTLKFAQEGKHVWYEELALIIYYNGFNNNNSRSTLHSLNMYPMIMRDGKIDLVLEEGGTLDKNGLYEKIEKINYFSQVEIKPYGYSICLGLALDYFHIDFSSTSLLGINAILKDVDILPQKKSCVISLADVRFDKFIPSNYICVEPKPMQ